jgi:hypothetical protein
METGELHLYPPFIGIHDLQNRVTTTTTKHRSLDRILPLPSITGDKWRHQGKGIALLQVGLIPDVLGHLPVVHSVLRGIRQITMIRFSRHRVR